MRNEKTLRMVQLTILAALVLLLALTPLGYLKFGVVEITLIPIPVAVGAILLGPACGAALGAVFGLTSAAQGIFGLSAFGEALFTIQPVLFILVCVLARILCGLLPGLLARLFTKEGRLPLWSYAVCALACALTNTVFFVGGVWLCFGQTEFIQNIGKTIWLFVVAAVGVNGLVESIATAIVGGAAARGVDAALMHHKH